MNSLHSRNASPSQASRSADVPCASAGCDASIPAHMIAETAARQAGRLKKEIRWSIENPHATGTLPQNAGIGPL
jgi:hypothetical protein